MVYFSDFTVCGFDYGALKYSFFASLLILSHLSSVFRCSIIAAPSCSFRWTTQAFPWGSSWILSFVSFLPSTIQIMLMCFPAIWDFVASHSFSHAISNRFIRLLSLSKPLVISSCSSECKPSLISSVINNYWFMRGLHWQIYSTFSLTL